MIFDDTICLLGEGPLWHPERKQLFWFDIMGRTLHTKGRHWGFDNFVSAAGWLDHDHLLVASSLALSRFNLTTGVSEIICPLEADNPVTRSNDGRADPYGGFWIGTMGIKAEAGAGSIWRYYKGELRRLFADITVSNAICFAPDGTTAYFSDTRTQLIMRQRLDPRDGWPVGDPQVHIDLRGTAIWPDGAVVDAAGNLWNAQWQSARVATYDPDGKYLFDTPFPASQTTCPAFGGPQLSTLFCTSAAVGLPQSHIAEHPASGRTFGIETRHKGQREHRVIL